MEDLFELVRVHTDVARLDDLQRALPGRRDVGTRAEEDDPLERRQVLREGDETALLLQDPRDPLRGGGDVFPQGLREGGPPRRASCLDGDPSEDRDRGGVADGVGRGPLLLAGLEDGRRRTDGVSARLPRDRNRCRLPCLRELDDPGGIPLPAPMAHDDHRVRLRELPPHRELERAGDAQVRLGP